MPYEMNRSLTSIVNIILLDLKVQWKSRSFARKTHFAIENAVRKLEKNSPLQSQIFSYLCLSFCWCVALSLSSFDRMRVLYRWPRSSVHLWRNGIHAISLHRWSLALRMCVFNKFENWNALNLFALTFSDDRLTMLQWLKPNRISLNSLP